MIETAGQNKPDRPSTIQSVERALDILTLLCNSNIPLSAKEIADALKMTRSTVNGLLNTLLQKKCVKKCAARGKYMESIKLFAISQKHLNKLPVLQETGKYWENNIGKRLNVSSNLGLYDEMNQVLTIRVYEQQGRNDFFRSYTSLPMYCTGIGKCLLAYFPEKMAEDIISQISMDAYTDHTITAQDALYKELESIRQCGYSLDQGELLENTYCIAFPIFDFTNNIIASCSIADSKETIESQRDILIRSGLQASKYCSIVLGWKPNKVTQG